MALAARIAAKLAAISSCWPPFSFLPVGPPFGRPLAGSDGSGGVPPDDRPLGGSNGSGGVPPDGRLLAGSSGGGGVPPDGRPLAGSDGVPPDG